MRPPLALGSRCGSTRSCPLSTDTADLNQAQVAARLGYSKNRIVADLDALERRRLLVRRPGLDRRANVLSATAAGVRLMNRVRADIHDGEDSLLTALPREQREELVATARAIAGTLSGPS